eukprot:364523-Chlamydomonas_euryale.AAC.3
MPVTGGRVVHTWGHTRPAVEWGTPPPLKLVACYTSTLPVRESRLPPRRVRVGLPVTKGQPVPTSMLCGTQATPVVVWGCKATALAACSNGCNADPVAGYVHVHCGRVLRRGAALGRGAGHSSVRPLPPRTFRARSRRAGRAGRRLRRQRPH